MSSKPDRTTAAWSVSRRHFLRNALAASTAASLGHSSPAHAQAGSGRGGGGGRGQAAQAAGPPPTAPIDPATAAETWIEPWVWRPGEWPGQQLHLNVVENENPGSVVGFGNPSAVIFSYGGITPGPTIRMRGDEVLFVKLRNLLGEDAGMSFVGAYPDPKELTPALTLDVVNQTARDQGNERHDFCLGEHMNGQHAEHVTNLHTHGLHVRPGRNPDGTHSDNVILRVMPQADLRQRESHATDPACAFLRNLDQISFLRDDEQAGQADYEFRLGHVQGNANQPHPPGTHWYHPHPHGATHNQVASGMAGFLIVEGDVDEALNRALAGQPTLPDLERATGPYCYRERLIFMQRVLVSPKDPDADTPALRSPAQPIVNGNSQPTTMVMRPGAVERWRVLNGSVDGRGFKRFMVLQGQFVYRTLPTPGLFEVVTNAAGERTISSTPVTRQQIDQAKQHLYQLAMDGVTLVSEDGRYTIKDLAAQNAGTTNPLSAPVAPPSNAAQHYRDLLRNYENVFRNGQNIRDCYVRPNEVYLGPANRTDVFFRAPTGAAGSVYTVFAQEVVVHADNYQQSLQGAVDNPSQGASAPEDIVLAYIVVKGDHVPGNRTYGPDLDIAKLIDVLPPVPPYLRPIGEDELRIPAAEAAARRVTAGDLRTRTLTYSGWGAQDFPLVTTGSGDPAAPAFEQFIAADLRDNQGRLRNLRYALNGTVDVLLPPATRTMAIDGRKFNPNDPERPRMLVDTAEEWALYNDSITLWGRTDAKPPGQYNGHYVAHPIARADGQRRFAGSSAFQIVTKGVDHPFHMHQNPFWVMRIEVPDENGELQNILDAPRWQDVIWIPRNAGRVVFRSRFPDFVGVYVNHCHLLLHEDNGMMQAVEVTPFDDRSNYVPKPASTDVNTRYPRPTLAEAYGRSISFVDPDPATGQTYPGFAASPPALDGA